MPEPDHDRRSASTAEQLRDAIDRGVTGEKVAGGDPAAAPLGSDDEAAGAPPTASQLSQAVGHEISPRRHPGDERHGPGSAWILIACAFAFVAIFVIAWAVTRA